MGLTKSRGNMYEFVDFTWNPIKGHCQFECSYCYVKSIDRFKKWEVPCHLDEKELTTNLGKGRKIFVGSMCDMWGSWIPDRWIGKVLTKCNSAPENEYVFQSKNPARFKKVTEPLLLFPPKTLLGTTIETDTYPEGFQTKAPMIEERVWAMMNLYPLRRFVTIEPIMDFNLSNLLRIIEMIKPEFATIGADSKGHGLEEPSAEKVMNLIYGLNEMKVEIRQKSNLERLLVSE
jgi:protein gp37